MFTFLLQIIKTTIYTNLLPPLCIPTTKKPITSLTTTQHSIPTRIEAFPLNTNNLILSLQRHNFFCRTMDDSFNYQSTLPQSSRTLCFVDASTLPDNGLSHQRRAGLGIYVVNLQVHPTNFIYIMATIQETHSVVLPKRLPWLWRWWS
jgi:hypothetical protein